MTFDLDATGQGVHVLATADGDVHAAHRAIVGPALAKRVRTLAPVVTALTEQLWTEELDGDRIDWATGVADRLPLALIAELLGLPGADVPTLLSLAYDSTEMLGGVVADGRMTALITSAAELAHYAYLAISDAKDRVDDRDSPRTLLEVLVAAMAAGTIDEQQAVLIVVQLIGAGGESTAGLIASSARLLATDLDLQTRLRERPELVPAFLDEALRLESPFRGHHRHVVTDTQLAGVDLPAGSHLLLLWGAANRDPAAYPNPDVVDLDRPRARAHAAFGAGAHFCIGSTLARLEATAALTLLLDRTERFSLIDAEPPTLAAQPVRPAPRDSSPADYPRLSTVRRWFSRCRPRAISQAAVPPQADGRPRAASLTRRGRSRLVAGCGTVAGCAPACSCPPACSRRQRCSPDARPPPRTRTRRRRPRRPVSSESVVPPTSPAANRTVVLDPGHNGGNAAHLAQINAPVPDGRGGTKACNTTGTSAASGYPEHEFTWDVTLRVRDALAARGVRVILTRPDDTGVGPCVDQRAAIANQSGADAVVSIHADGNTGAGAHGFHIAYAEPPLNPVQAEAGTRLATALRDAMVAGGAVP